MRASRREVSIFNMSLLDILCGALGAFCFLTLTLFPYYGKKEQDSGARLAEADHRVAEAKKKLAALTAQPDSPEAQSARQAQEKVRSLQAALADTQSIENQLQQAREDLQQAKRDGAAKEQRKDDAERASLERQIADLKNYLAQPEPKEDGLVLNGAPFLAVYATHPRQGPGIKIDVTPRQDFAFGDWSSSVATLWIGEAPPARRYQARFITQPAALSPQMGVRVFVCARRGCQMLEGQQIVPGPGAGMRSFAIDLDSSGGVRLAF